MLRLGVHRFGMLRFLCGFKGGGWFMIDLGEFPSTIDMFVWYTSSL